MKDGFGVEWLFSDFTSMNLLTIFFVYIKVSTLVDKASGVSAASPVIKMVGI